MKTKNEEKTIFKTWDEGIKALVEIAADKLKATHTDGGWLADKFADNAFMLFDTKNEKAQISYIFHFPDFDIPEDGMEHIMQKGEALLKEIASMAEKPIKRNRETPLVTHINHEPHEKYHIWLRDYRFSGDKEGDDKAILFVTRFRYWGLVQLSIVFSDSGIPDVKKRVINSSAESMLKYIDMVVEQRRAYWRKEKENGRL